VNGAGATDPDSVTRRLAGQGVDAVAIGWVDNAGLHRVKAVPLDRLAAAARGAVTMSRQLDAALPDDTHAEDAVPRGTDVALLPDLSAAVVPAAREHQPVRPFELLGVECSRRLTPVPGRTSGRNGGGRE
jgi:glutamine synthetase